MNIHLPRHKAVIFFRGVSLSDRLASEVCASFGHISSNSI